MVGCGVDGLQHFQLQSIPSYRRASYVEIFQWREPVGAIFFLLWISKHQNKCKTWFCVTVLLGLVGQHISELPRGQRGLDPSDSTPHSHQHLGFISEWLLADKRSRSSLEQKRKLATFNQFFFSPLPAFHRPPCRSSIFTGLAAKGGGVFLSLTNVVQIACSTAMGEHLDLVHTVFFYHHSLTRCARKNIQIEERLSDPLSAVVRILRTWRHAKGHLLQDVGLVSTAVVDIRLIPKPHAQSAASLIARKSFWRRYVFVCCFQVCLS